MFATDAIIGFNRLSLLVYASFLLSVLIGRLLNQKRDLLRISGATFPRLAAILLDHQLRSLGLSRQLPTQRCRLAACYLAGAPLFWNTLAGDAVYTAFLFGAFFLAEHLAPRLRPYAASNL